MVTMLPRDAFSITEDKAPQRIKDFEPPSAHAMPGAAAALVEGNADLPKIGNAPVNVLVFDEVNTPFLQLAFARQQMEKYLQAQPETLPVPTLFVAVGAKRIGVLHDYTQSRADLLASVKTHTADLDFTTVLAGLNGGSSGAEKRYGADARRARADRGEFAWDSGAQERDLGGPGLQEGRGPEQAAGV